MSPFYRESFRYWGESRVDTIVLMWLFCRRWYYNRNQREEPVEDSSGHYVVRDGSLIIQGVQESDGGSYMCTASNSEGSESMEVRLTVSAPLNVHVQPSIQTVDLGKAAHLVIDNFPSLREKRSALPTHFFLPPTFFSNRERTEEAANISESRGWLVYRQIVRSPFAAIHGIIRFLGGGHGFREDARFLRARGNLERKRERKGARDPRTPFSSSPFFSKLLFRRAAQVDFRRRRCTG